MLPAYSAPLEDSGASMAAKSRSMRRSSGALAFLVNHSICFIELFLLYSQEDPSAISTAVDAPGHKEPDHKEPDPLQQEVDPKRLVSSRSKGPPRHRHISTHLPSGGRVYVPHIACACRERADRVDTLTLCAESL